jgi:orotidine-5'-phosphate decarboxylase
MAPKANFLIPGVGAQGGDLEAAVRYGPDAKAGPVINASRGVIYASTGEDFAEAARSAARKLRDEINSRGKASLARNLRSNERNR